MKAEQKKNDCWCLAASGNNKTSRNVCVNVRSDMRAA